jgi:hypothetical protein
LPRGSGTFVPTNFFYSGSNAFFSTLGIWQKLDRGATERSQLFNMMGNMIANPIKLPGAMLTISSEISQFGNRHTMLNHFQHGRMISHFQFWLIFGCILKETVLAVMPMKTMVAILLLASSALPSTPSKDAAMTPMQSPPRYLPYLRPPLLRLVGLQGQGGNDDGNIDPRGNDNNDTIISLKIGWGGRWLGRR